MSFKKFLDFEFLVFVFEFLVFVFEFLDFWFLNFKLNFIKKKKKIS